MRARVSNQKTVAVRLAGAGVACICAGCAHIADSATQRLAPPVVDAGSLYSLASSSVRSTIYEAPTVSFALDRIDQRSLPLDRTYRHGATGKGVTVYVFDGGVSTTHPELAGRVRVGYSGFPTIQRSVIRTAPPSPARSLAQHWASRPTPKSST